MEERIVNFRKIRSTKNTIIITLLITLAYSFTTKQTSTASDYLLIQVQSKKHFHLVYVNKKEVGQQGVVEKYIMLTADSPITKRKYKSKGFEVIERDRKTGRFVFDLLGLFQKYESEGWRMVGSSAAAGLDKEGILLTRSTLGVNQYVMTRAR